MTCCTAHAVIHGQRPARIAKAAPISARKAWKELHRIADKFQPRVKRAFLKSLEELKGETKLAEIVKAVETGRVEVVVRVLGLDSLETRLKTLTEELRGVYQEAAQGPGIASLPSVAAAYRFDLMNPHSIDFLQRYNFNLVQGISRNTRDALRGILVDAFQYGVAPMQSARRIRQVVGLTPRMAQAVVAYERGFEELDYDLPTVDKLVTRYISRLTNDRAKSIARTETIRAAGAGREAAWQDAAAQGFIDKREVRREWLVTDDDRLCPACAEMPDLNEGGVGMDDAFKVPDGYDSVTQEPLHVNCRCSVVLTYPEELGKAADFDESQHPRDEDGKFTEAGGSRAEVFHGTASLRLSGILAGGIKIAGGERSYDRNHYRDSRGRSVYVTQDFDRALTYAEHHQQYFGETKTINIFGDTAYPTEAKIREAVIVHLSVPKSLAAKFRQDEKDSKGLRFEAGLPAKYITGYTVVKQTSISGEVKREFIPVRKQELEKMYFILSVEELASMKEAA